MKWTDNKEPNQECPYHHTKLDTPIGTFIIEWKGYKEKPDDYCIHLCNEMLTNWLAPKDSLEEAKEFVTEYLRSKMMELHSFLEADFDKIASKRVEQNI